MLPHDPFADVGDWKCKYQTETADVKIITDYTGIDFNTVFDMNILDAWRLLKEAVIHNASQTEKGRDWIDRAWAAEQTEPDREALRAIFGKGAK